MAICPLAESTSTLARKVGETVQAALRSTSCWRMSSLNPPMRFRATTPTRSGSKPIQPASHHASFAAREREEDVAVELADSLAAAAPVGS